MDAFQHAYLFTVNQKEAAEEDFHPINILVSEEYVDGIPLRLKIETLENKLTEALSRQKEKIEKLRNSDIPDRSEKIFIAKRNIEEICDLRLFPITSLDEYEYANWCYNAGQFRTAEEIAIKKAEIAEINEQRRIDAVRCSPDFNKHYHPILWFLLWLFGPSIIIGFIWEGNIGFGAGLASGLAIFAFTFTPSVIIAAIATWIYCSVYASLHDVPMSRFEQEAIIGCTTYAVIKHHYDKKAVNRKLERKRRFSKFEKDFHSGMNNFIYEIDF